MNIPAILAFISFSGIVIIINRNLSYIRGASKEQLLLKINNTKSLRISLYKFIIVPLINIWSSYGRKWFFKGIEKIVGKVRVIVVKIERRLEKFTNYIHGKHKVEKNGNYSKYWNDVSEFKNGLNNDDTEKPV